MSFPLPQIYLFCLFFVLNTSSAFGNSFGTEIQERRTTLGLALFPNIVSIDLDLSQKRTQTGSVLLLVVFENTPELASNNLQKLKKKLNTIQKYPVELRLISVSDLIAEKGEKLTPAGMFLSEDITGKAMRRVVQFSEQKRCILFSPFENAVSRGVMVGISITSKIQPVINMTSLEKSSVKLHRFFLNSSQKIYD